MAFPLWKAEGNRPDEFQLEAIIATQAALVAGEFDLDRFMDLVVERVQGLTGATGAVVELVEGNEIVYRAAGGTVAPHVGLRIAREGSLSGLCVAEQRILIAEDTENDPRVNRDACRKVEAASMVVVPLFQRGAAVGVVKIVSRDAHAFGDREVETLRLMAGLLGGALGQQLEIDHRRKLEERLRHIAHTDTLTDLPNRLLFNDRFERAVLRSARSGKLLALFYIDLDGFKRVIDTLGHAAGDALLSAFSRRVRSLTRQTDTLARMGGDEFALIAEDFPYVAAAERAAATIVEAAGRPFALSDGNSAEIGASIGVALSEGHDIDRDRMLRTADEALYRVKRKGGGGFEVVILPRSDAPPEAARVQPRE